MALELHAEVRGAVLLGDAPELEPHLLDSLVRVPEDVDEVLQVDLHARHLARVAHVLGEEGALEREDDEGGLGCVERAQCDLRAGRVQASGPVWRLRKARLQRCATF